MDGAPDPAADDLRIPTPLDRVIGWFTTPRPYRLTRGLILRALALVYLFAFLGLVHQALPLIGSHGLLPAARYLDNQRALGHGFTDHPTLFWIDCSDRTLSACAWLGLALAIVAFAGYGNMPIYALLWVLYGSFEKVGQLWFSFGWEIQLLETGFLAIFLAPPLDPRPRHARAAPVTGIVLARWLTFRIMLGAGLIKWHGDACWRELTCLDNHFETQPIPNPLSGLYHRAPHVIHAIGVVFNHVVELIAPWFVFGPRPARLVAGVLMLLFQLTLISSGNLAFLNWLTIVPILACFDDDALRAVMPRRLRAWLDARAPSDEVARAALGQRIAVGVYAVIVAYLSLAVIDNLMAGQRQQMNFSYDRFALVNTYGAFGSVGQFGVGATPILMGVAGQPTDPPGRREIVVEGTSDPVPDDSADWRAYDLPCKPGALDRTPCILGPYHLRLDWLFWFAAMDDDWRGAPWVVHVSWKLLHGDRGLLSLFGSNPFPDAPPRWIRVRRFDYAFAGAGSSDWWVRSSPTMWMPPFSIDSRGDDPTLAAYLRRAERDWPPIDR